MFLAKFHDFCRAIEEITKSDFSLAVIPASLDHLWTGSARLSSLVGIPGIPLEVRKVSGPISCIEGTIAGMTDYTPWTDDHVFATSRHIAL